MLSTLPESKYTTSIVLLILSSYLIYTIDISGLSKNIRTKTVILIGSGSSVVSLMCFDFVLLIFYSVNISLDR